MPQPLSWRGHKNYAFKQRIIILSSLLFYKSNNINNNNHLNKVDKHSDMFSYRLIKLTITCNELLWSNSISFSFLFFFYFFFFTKETTQSESKYYFFLIPYLTILIFHGPRSYSQKRGVRALPLYTTPWYNTI